MTIVVWNSFPTAWITWLCIMMGHLLKISLVVCLSSVARIFLYHLQIHNSIYMEELCALFRTVFHSWAKLPIIILQHPRSSFWCTLSFYVQHWLVFPLLFITNV
jgi:hypothetical protein